MKISSKLCMSFVAMAISLYAQAYPGESIVQDPVTGNYTITYRGDPNSTELSQTVFVPSTKIDPNIRSSFRVGARDVVMYHYTVSNGATAKQAIVGVLVDEVVNPILGEPAKLGLSPTKAVFDAYVAAEKAAIASPVGWGGDITRYRIATHGENLDRIAWMPNGGTLRTNGIQAGRTLSGFGFNSLDLPDVGPSQMDGIGDVLSFPDEGPIESSAVFAQLERLRDNDFVRRNAAVPAIAVPVPFDAAITLDRIRTHVSTWTGKQLVDPAFAAQLDRYLVSAADAYRRNQLKAGKEHIETLREMLKREHKDLDRDDDENENGKRGEKNDDHRTVNQRLLIDRLGARILDFDLRYVLKRTEREDDEHNKH